MHWANRIYDIKTLDVVRDDYLFGSSNVQIQHRNINNQERELCKENSTDLERGLSG